MFVQGRYFYHYSQLEDIYNGAYDDFIISQKNKKLVISMFVDSELFWDTMRQMKIDWPNCFNYNLSNKTINRRAWLGQASANYSFGVAYKETIIYWNLLNESQKSKANYTAQKMIDLYERELNGKKILKNGCFDRCERTIEMDF